MKKQIVALIMCCCVSISGAAVPSANLFSDNYNRANNLDIDASSSGMSGTLSPMTYVEIGDTSIYPVQSGTGLPYPELTQVNSNTLYMAYGTNMSTMYLDHNFVDSAILTADGMRIGMTILQDLGPLTGNQAFVGFGIGNTLQQCQTTWFDHNGTGFRGQLGTVPLRAGTSDLWIGWSPVNSGTIQVFKNGPTGATPPGYNYNLKTGVVLTGHDRLELELYFDSFADNAPVKANILWNGVIIGKESFNWDADGLLENYIGINGRQTVGWVVDDLAIEAIYEDRAHTPAPIDGAELVNTSGLALSWYKGKDASGNPNAAITKHYLYIHAGEPNFVGATPIPVTDTADPVTNNSYAFASDTLYYWRVDESINNSSASDPNTITGYVWSFDTYTFPIIDANPGTAIVAPAGTAVLTCNFTSVTTPIVKWFKSGTPDVEVTAGGDITIDVTNTGGAAYTTTLTVANVEVADEGAYYCQIENASGPLSAVTSGLGRVGVKREVAHWTLDETDFVGGQYLDISGEGHHADPNIVPGSDSFVEGADETETGGLDLTVEPLAAGDSGAWDPTQFTDEMTISVWCKWASSDGAWHGLVSKKTQSIGEAWFLQISDTGNISFTGTGITAMTSPMPVGEWVHIAVTASPISAKHLYVNGLEKASVGTALLSRIASPIYIGANNRDQVTGSLISTFNGVLDDVRIYNFAKDKFAIGDLYYAIEQKPLCLNPDNVGLGFDLAGGGVNGDEPDCKVNLKDFILFTQNWLSCGLYPLSECQ